MKIITLNIHKGFSAFNRNYTLDQIRLALQKLKVDVVCLQEVMGEHSHFAKAPQFKYLAEQTWKHHAYGKNAIYTKGHHGNAILSHYPFQSHRNVDISNNRFERRGILHGILTAPNREKTKIHVMTLHLDLLSWGRRRQIEKLCKLIRPIPRNEPLIVCGDFNDWNEKCSDYLERHANLTEVFQSRTGQHAFTFPSRFPFLKLDRIYVRGITVVSTQLMSHAPWNMALDACSF